MNKLFDEIKIGRITLKNRMIMAPMTRSRANDEGVQPDYAAEYYSQRASAGLIVTEATNISAMAKGYVRMPGIFSDDQKESWRKIVNSVHEQGGKIFLQLFHAGRISLPDFLPVGIDKPVAPSAVKAIGQNFTDEGMKDFVEPKELTKEEIKAIVNNFATAAKNAVDAGFDGVEYHCANGYLPQQFLSTNVNLRNDEYGGSVKNRARFVLESLDAIIATIGSERTSIRISPGLENNDIKEEDSAELYEYLVAELSKRNLAFLDVASMNENKDWHAALRTIYKGVYFASAGFDRESGEKLVAENGADGINYGRLFLANPDLPMRFELGTELNEWDESTFYSSGVEGYTDYPFLEQ